MSMSSRTTTISWRSRVLGVVLGGAAFLAAGAAAAGECPADKMVPSGQGQAAGATAPKAVTDKVLGMLDLGAEPVGIEGRLFRLRRLEVYPGGEVPWHSHEDRPAIIYVVSGTITEFSSDCAVPIVHQAGEVSVEDHGVAHWWKNMGRETVVLLSADLLHQEDDPHTM
jgi:quercetin dioxygenase-like cupin family protein